MALDDIPPPYKPNVVTEEEWNKRLLRWEVGLLVI
jgi:hypothetical protein